MQKNADADKIQPDDVQGRGQIDAESGSADEIRPDGVQQKVTEFNEFRQDFVQSTAVTEPVEAGDGQVSREFLTEELTENAKPDKPQVLWSETAQTPQNVVQMDNLDSGLRNIEPMTEQKPTGGKKKKSNRAHEGKSELAEGLHESTSELTGGKQSGLHESESEFAETLHENKSEKAEILHENESELAECIARELLDGLRRAAWVR